MTIYDVSLFFYNLALLPVVFFSILFFVLTLINLLIDRKDTTPQKPLKKLPFVTVHVPTFNDPIGARCVRHCMKFDYPKDKYEIIIVDDSTNTKTQSILKKFADENPGFIKYIHRDNRVGYKPGALQNAMKITKGEIIVVFDADWMPKKPFLKKIVQPFSDPNVAIVQTRQGFYNSDTNLITRFASYLLLIYHTIVLPINNKINCVFFCGTAGALRRSAFDKVGGWNIHSITEDSELSVKLLIAGYKTVYVDYETPSEVPDTFESFIKQQMRWCYGNARVFFDNWKKIMFTKCLTFKQKFVIGFITLSNFSTIVVVLMTLFGFGGWFLGELRLFTLGDLTQFWIRMVLTAGFLFMGLVALIKRNKLNEFKYLILSMFTMGLVIAVSSSVAFTKAMFNSKLNWYCTPKIGNEEIIKNG
ncbi:MAG: glycosyltransferase [Nanoarchaeota archaeon]|nr:glycosyltransferase [Nanoarchaeota archaeon]MBU1704791.1 glycosyltransferase [Nanoarchaeota archaeon]